MGKTVKRVSRRVVLGLRATPEERAWMVAMAEKRGLSLQAYFEQIMRQQEGSPWHKPDEQLVSVPSSMMPMLRDLSTVQVSGNETVLNLVRQFLRECSRTVKGAEEE